MFRHLLMALAFLALAGDAGQADALCIYKGMENAQTTIEQEFEDSALVVRARVHSADYHWALDGDSWTIYRLEVVEQHKGAKPSTLYLFTMRDSGGFYLDRTDEAVPSDEDFLLFLKPTSVRPGNLTSSQAV